jgi:hypothetical protein
MMLGVPVPNSAPDLAEKVQASLFGQVPEITDQVCNGMIVPSAAVPLKYRDSLCGPGDVFDLIDHALPSTTQPLAG